MATFKGSLLVFNWREFGMLVQAVKDNAIAVIAITFSLLLWLFVGKKL
jgi:hypothetical protein